MSRHPINNPAFDKFDYARSMLGTNAGAAFQMLTEEGGTDQDVIELAQQFQGVIARTAKAILLTKAESYQVPPAPEFMSGLGQAPPDVQPKNPFEDSE